MNIFLSLKNFNTYTWLQCQIVTGNAPILSKLIYNDNGSQSIYKFNLNEYDYSTYGFPKAENNCITLNIEPTIIGLDDGIGDFIKFNLC